MNDNQLNHLISESLKTDEDFFPEITEIFSDHKELFYLMEGCFNRNDIERKKRRNR